MREAREVELKNLLAGENGWKEIKAIAESSTPPIAKPEGGWKEAIPLILDAEFPSAEAPVETVEAPAGESAELKPIYPVEFLNSAGIATCSDCGSPPTVNLEGAPHCPYQKSACPLLETN